MSVEVFGDKTEVFAYIGAATVGYAAFKFAWTLMRAFLTYGVGKLYPLREYLIKRGSWAVITGATDGIGKAYAEQLAKFGFDIVLVSRTESKLRAVAGEIEQQYKVKTKIIAADFSKGYSIYEDIKEKLHGLSIGVLVNNVGLSYEFPEFFLDIPNRDKLLADLMYVNCASVTQMSAIVLPSMVERKKGLIINISSAAGLRPVPLLSVYSACKAYVTMLSDCLNTEYSRYGVDVQCVSPYFVCSNMSKVKRPSLLIPSATTYVKSALMTLPFQSSTLGYWPHALLEYCLSWIPGSIALAELMFATLNYMRKNKEKRDILEKMI